MPKLDLDFEECIDCGQEVLIQDNGYNALCCDCGGIDEPVIKEHLDTYGRNVNLRLYGQAIILQAWIDGKAVYADFFDLGAVQAWIDDNALALDATNTAVIKLVPVCNQDDDLVPLAA